MKQLTVVETEDGSKTCRHHLHQGSYRSMCGALMEVRHVFIDSTFYLGGAKGLREWQVLAQDLRVPKNCAGVEGIDGDVGVLGVGDGAKRRVKILEFGFGLGTSMAHTLGFARDHNLFCEYLSVEREPVDPEYAQHPDPELRGYASELLLQLRHQDRGEIQGEGFKVSVVRGDFLQLSDDFLADAIYFDPFGPRENPESWSVEVFALAAQKVAPWGRLATYSAAGWVRRAAAEAGWVLARRPGFGKKREITVAALCQEALPESAETGLKRLSMSRYRRVGGDCGES